MTLKFASLAGPAAVPTISHGPGKTFCSSAGSPLNARTKRVSVTCSTSVSAPTGIEATTPAARAAPVPVGNPKPLRKLGHQLGPFGLGPGSGGAGAHVSQRTGCKREFGDMIPERCFGDDKEIMLARGEINFLDLDPDFLGEFSRRLTALRSVLDRANSLVGPVDRQYKCRHVVLHRSDRLIACRSRGRPTCSMLKLRERHKGRRCVQTASLPT